MGGMRANTRARGSRAPIIVISVIGIVLAVIVALGLMFWHSAATVGESVRQAGGYARQAQSSFKDGDLKTALKQLDRAGASVEDAHREAETPIWRIASVVPYYGSDVTTVRGLLSAGADASANALPKIESAADGTLVDTDLGSLFQGTSWSDGTLSIPRIHEAKTDIQDAADVMARVKTTIDDLPETHVQQVTDAVDQAKDSAAQASDALDSLGTMLSHIPG
ncbi:moaA protein [Bifidobacterium vansinderenii]|uniref:MoaA protein n=2 Tax=Bifidobacterium vansinderenii TaxID=1984871 RepID=A0A229W047_9BIFI|nr:moaA protein [Bifidobacterium vansinderenii]